ncbi:thiosulfate oxidation carrier protein SoxY [Polynucleobacter arcticus]|uniref:Thiosulfate oxidation carrier protein SoxY n=1 Tax=Polynucleobacter arcticus TaxID=1743165 RepID=A0A6M9PJE8_9BURK|nr:thiosulfate oxidation carrier protein SoxY [Polynucleobacter arcticus]QKM60521.1 thiosulfate oxidation carrier protein SoxY [Polynucleobacter arcticus]
MDRNRRNIIKSSVLFSALASIGMITPAQAAEWNTAAFNAKTVEEVLKSLGVLSPENSNDIVLKVPDLVETSAVVPIIAQSKIRVQQFAILVDKNPSVLAAQLFIPQGTEPFVRMNVKMAQSSNVILLAQSSNKWFMTSTAVKVTLGGCG